MPVCPACATAGPDHSRFCPSCGAALAPAGTAAAMLADAETRLTVTPAGFARTPALTTTSAHQTDIHHGRFLPGVTLASRYRIVGRIGRGGMGEVYRADDLRLGQQVALKFLPEALATDPTRLAQFHAEVRLARQVSHPNVCRVYDVDEDGGHTFLSMEYIDGEDLASLLRRIGRLPEDKALELARQLCAGLAAAHERGVIHRDLKPANLMIDGEGRLRVTDFGIAALATVEGPTAGTPGYMAPELLAGGPASVRSDIYALGLVLYELFTGRKPFSLGSLAELIRAQQETEPAPPTSWVRDLDPAIERAIIRCLKRDPDARPPGALAVAAMLPGGDPLAAALAAGETPSPQMVAAAGEAEALAPWKGVALLGAVAAALGAVLLLADRTYLVNLVPLDKAPEVLADRAAELTAQFGYPGGVDSASGFAASRDFLNYVARDNQDVARWTQLRESRGASVLYWYRTSPRTIVPMGLNARAGLHDPPMAVSGMAGVVLDTRGRLVEFHGVPPQYDAGGAPSAPDWKPLFAAAQLDMTRFASASPSWTPRQYADVRAAWTGTVPEHPGVTLRVEAAAYQGIPVFFVITGPWTQPSRMQERPRTRAEVLLSTVGALTIVAMLAGAILLAWRNWRRGRGDRAGALFAATLLFALSFASRALRMSHVPELGVETDRFFGGVVAVALLDFGLLWVLYMAVEPSVRRFWPDSLKGWSRLVSGRIRDARVGRDLLYGTVAGAVIAAIGAAHDLVPPLVGAPPPTPTMTTMLPWLGGRFALAEALLIMRNALQSAGLVLFMVVLLRMLLRGRAAAFIGSVLIFLLLSGGQIIGSTTPALALAFGVIIAVGLVGVLVRFGLLTTMVTFATYFLLANFPLTSSFGAWQGRPAAFAVMLVAAVAVAGFWLARDGAPLFGRPLLDE